MPESDELTLEQRYELQQAALRFERRAVESQPLVRDSKSALLTIAKVQGLRGEDLAQRAADFFEKAKERNDWIESFEVRFETLSRDIVVTIHGTNGWRLEYRITEQEIQARR